MPAGWQAGVTAVALGTEQTCALDAQGRFGCWGLLAHITLPEGSTQAVEAVVA